MINTDFFSVRTYNSSEFKTSLSPEVTIKKVLLSEGSFCATAELHLLHLRGWWDSYTMIHRHTACASPLVQQGGGRTRTIHFVLRAQIAHDVYTGNEVQASCQL